MTTRNEILNKLDIKPGEWVLEIGSGPSPFYRSDILLDKDLNKDAERSEALVIDRPMIICDAHNLPFMAKSFDCIFCSQTLEHLENPRQFFAEIERIGRKGYIETPNEIRERLFGWPFHKWIVDKDENGLVLRENDLEQAFGLFFHKLQLQNYEFAKFCLTSHNLLNICYEWHGKPNFRFANPNEYRLTTEKVYVRGEDVAKFVLSGPYDKRLSEQIDILKWTKKHIPKKLKQFMKRVTIPPPCGHRHSDKETQTYLSEILACPVCKVAVTIKDKNEIACAKCGRSFEINGGIPFMLVE